MKNPIIQKLQNANKLGIAFGGGGARGLAHIGVLKVLDELNIKPVIASGSSFGAIVGAFHCNGYAWQEIIQIIEDTKWRQVLDFAMGGGLIKGEAFAKVLRKHLPDKFEELKLPLSIVATNIETGTEVVLRSGDLITAIRASSCFPGLFRPVEMNGMKLIDGGVIDNVPVAPLYTNLADRTIAVNVNTDDYPLEKDESNFITRVRKKLKIAKPGLPMDIMLKTVDMMQSRIARVNLAISKPDLYIHVKQPFTKLFHFDKYKEIIEEGVKITRNELGFDEIKKEKQTA